MWGQLGEAGQHSAYAAVVPLRRRLAAVALATYSVVLLGILLNPSSAPGSAAVDVVADLLTRMNVPSVLARPERVEFALNVAIFVPWAALAAAVWPSLNWRDWTAYGFAATAIVETGQALLLAGRTPTFSDVVANTLGALLGAMLVSALRRIGGGGDAAG